MRIFPTVLASALSLACAAGAATVAEKRAAEMLETLLAESAVEFPPNYKITISHADIADDSVELRAGGRSAEINYANPDDAESAVGEFAEKFLGVRVLAPPPLGIVRDGSAKFAAGKASKNFSYSGRFFPQYDDASKFFAAANGKNDTYALSAHSLTRIVNATVAAEHPDWLAMRRGKRISFAETKQPQIDFLNADVRKFAADKTREFFEKHPDRKMFSVSYADAPNFDDTPPTALLRRPATPHGYADYGNAVFAFTNAVANAVSARYPDRLVAEIAYLYTENPPDFKMSPNAAVFLCADRQNNFDETERKKDLKLLEKWAKSGVGRLGIYDYNYGAPYFVPRGSPKLLADSLKYARRLGATLYVCESRPLWAYDAHKMYILSKLLKDANADADKLRGEFFRSYFGNAAGSVDEFFETAENAWLSRRDKPAWLKLYKRESQAELLDADTIGKMESALSAAETAKGATQTERDRVREIRLVFDITKAFVDAYKLQKKLFEGAESDADAIETLEALQIAETRKRLAMERYDENTKYPKFDFSVWKKISFIDARELVGERLLKNPQTAGRAKKLLGDDFARLAELAADAVRISENPDFENGLAGWRTFKLSASPETLAVSDKRAYSGRKSVAMSSQNFVGITNSVRASGGKVYAAEARIHGNVGIGEVCYARLSFSDKNGRQISAKRIQAPSGFFDFAKLRIIAKAPENAASASFSVFVGNTRGTVFVDDAKILERRRRF